VHEMSEAERRAFLTTGTRTGKLATVRADGSPHVVPVWFVLDDEDAKLRYATHIGGRYMGADRAEEFGRRNAVPSELLVRLPPTRLVARAGIAD
jgi:Pyridoxamine 5'-phosphate oxidase